MEISSNFCFRISIPIKELLSKEYAKKRRELIKPTTASVDIVKGSPVNISNTVYFCVVDGKGNACSFINSNYMGFGTGSREFYADFL